MEWVNTLTNVFPGKLRGDEYFIKECPYCNNPKSNMQVNIKKLIFHCWACGAKGTARALFKDYGINSSVVPPKANKQEEGEVCESKPEVSLPPEALCLLSAISPLSNIAKHYLYVKRRLAPEDVRRYGIMYCEEGEYRNRVIVPLYEDGELVYFVARAFTKMRDKYKNPAVPKHSLLPVFYGRKQRATVVLVEGVFGAIAMNQAGYTAIPLLGKEIHLVQLQKLSQLYPRDVIVYLNHDAHSHAIEIAQKVNDVFGGEKAGTKVAISPGPDEDELTIEQRIRVIEEAEKPSLLGFLNARMEGR